VLAFTAYLFLGGFALFLLGLSVFMYFEGRKFGDNQFTVKLLPPPPKRDSAMLTAEALVMVNFVASAGLTHSSHQNAGSRFR
jgi:hypothetical protein